jgi:hypothetical protein
MQFSTHSFKYEQLGDIQMFDGTVQLGKWTLFHSQFTECGNNRSKQDRRNIIESEFCTKLL